MQVRVRVQTRQRPGEEQDLDFLDTVEGWLNLGGVKFPLREVNPRVSRSGDRVAGKVLLTSKGHDRACRREPC
jgi:hypothetical protein